MLGSILFSLALAAGSAQPKLDSLCGKIGSALTENEIAKIVDLARKNITAAQLSDGKPVPAETPEELKGPVVPVSLSSCTVKVGVMSAMAESCGLDYEKRIFDPFMNLVRATGNLADKQIAFVGLLHGVALGAMSNQIAKASKCPPDARAKLDKTFPEPKQK